MIVKPRGQFASQVKAAKGLLRLTLVLTALLCGYLPAQKTPANHAFSAGDLSQYLGQRIVSVEFRSSEGTVSGEEQNNLRDLVPLKRGEALTRAKLRDSLRALYATQRFAEIEADATPSDGGVSVTISTKPNFFIGSMTAQGEPAPPSASQLLNSTKLGLGQLFSVATLDPALLRMKRVLEDNGYYQPTITPKIDYNHENFLVHILFQVEPGKQARVGRVIVTGDPDLSPEEIQENARLHPGDRVTASRITGALQRLRKRFQKNKRLEAQVSITAKKYNPEPNTVDYTFAIDRGPKVDIQLEGAKLRSGLVKKYIPVYEENAVDEDLLNEGRRNLRDYFQSKGYFDAEVKYENKNDPTEDKITVVYQIDKGEHHKLTDVVININPPAGNKPYFHTETIRERMSVTAASPLLFYGQFSQTMLSRDIQAIENLYKENGFLEVKVGSNVEDDYDNQLGRMRVTITIDEGPQIRVNTLTIEGNASYKAEFLQDLISTSQGQPFSDANLANDRDAILSFYFNRGFPDVKFEGSVEPAAEKTNLVNVRFKITEGEQTFVRRVVFSGLDNTHPDVVQREMRLKNGDPLSQSAMLETQRRLYDIGIFNEVNMAVQNPTGSARDKNVVFQLEEAKRYTFSYGLGLEVQTGSVASTCKNLPNPAACQPQGRTGLSPRVSFDVTRVNFLGRDHTLIFKSRLGRLQQRALFSYEAPRWFNSEKIKLAFTAFFDKTQDVRTFTSERLEGSVQLQQKYSKASTFLYRIAYRNVKVDPATLQVRPEDIPLFSKPVRIGIPSLTYIRDTRDDPIDSKRGAYNTFDFGVASSVFGSESNFVRMLLQNSTYHPFKNKRWVFARSAKIGIEEPFGSLLQSLVPLPERFYGGGGNSHRGFGINQAGPRDSQTGFPLGGEALFLNSFEVRTPPIALPFFEENLSAVIFHDAGNVFATGADVLSGLFRLSQKNGSSCRDLTPTATCDFAYISHAIGAGLRYKTPIGPVRVDVGYNLNPTVFPDRDRIRISTTSRFNFFFSLGQTF